RDWVDSGLSASCDRKGRAAVGGSYLSGKHRSGTSGRSSAAGKISGSRVLPRRWPEASREKGRGGGLQIVGVATTTPQHRATSARYFRPALICSPFPSIGWSVPIQRSTL